MKNKKLKPEVEEKIKTKLHEVVSEMEVLGGSITKAIANTSKKIAKLILKKIKQSEKAKSDIKKTTASAKKRRLDKSKNKKIATKKKSSLPKASEPLKKDAAKVPVKAKTVSIKKDDKAKA